MLKHVHVSSICARHGVLRGKVVHRVHWSESKQSHIFPGSDPKCDTCYLGPTNLAHMHWTRPTLSLFWRSVFDSLSAITSADIYSSLLVVLFVSYLLALHYLYFLKLVAFLSLLVILMHPKSPCLPHILPHDEGCSIFHEIREKKFKIPLVFISFIPSRLDGLCCPHFNLASSQSVPLFAPLILMSSFITYSHNLISPNLCFLC